MKSVSPNPAQDYLTLEFANAQEAEMLPAYINLYSDNSAKIVKSVSIQDVYKQRAFAEGDKVKISVGDLPRGTYYLHVIPAEGSRQDTQKIRIVLN